jgi:tryptophan synthase alpha chain
MGIFLTCGYPDGEVTLPLLQAIDRGGADFIELGMPFSDPLAEGVPIQRSSAMALSHGTTLSRVLEVASAFRETSSTPLVLMGYINPVFRFGVGAFCTAAAAAGVDGLILPDLPLEAAGLIRTEAMEAGLDLIFLIAPNTPPDRIRSIDSITTGFVYAVAFAGLTGDRIDTGDSYQAYLQRARGLITNPLLVGFGIRSAADAESASRHTDGFIVGSALVNLIDAQWSDSTASVSERLQEVESFVRGLRPELAR